MSPLVKTLSWGLFFTTTITACSFFNQVDETLPDHRVDYKKSQTVPPLEIPPSLSSETIQEKLIIPEGQESSESGEQKTESSGEQENSKVLPQSSQVQVKRVGKTRWLVIHASPESIWSKVKNFWIESGFSLKREEPQIGLLETHWLENRADIPQDAFRKLVGKLLDNLYSASTRDKFKIRLERGEQDGTTELYLTHQGVQEVSQGDQFVWQARPSDHELEAEMLSRLMAFLGGDGKQVTKLTDIVQNLPKVDFVEDPLSLVIQEEFINVWRRTGLALERLELALEDRNVEKGEYQVRYTPEPEDRFFAGWFRNETPKTYLIKLSDEHTKTRISVLNKQGQQENDDTVRELLDLLQKELSSE